ncbi:hypothetical protein [Massilia sp. H6]|uniref:hypothetical protein n=1 Tax=Massilia sp. H6 TaxID=2970464 RepID=UPI00216A773F|nr:hypothetical protein [Massilia sp. H6]UVW27224.1 hypothetical protein NRS07_11675 [Massilia sp. H6]
MLSRPALQVRLVLSACALAAEALHLGWEFTHGGVPSHHLLNRADLPAMSNWWGLLVVPLLVWLLVGRIQRRGATLVQAGSRARFRTLVLVRFGGALLWGAVLALAFAQGHPAVSFIFLGAFVAGVFLHLYRAEYVLGFALGLTFTFGAVLPVLIASVIAGCSFLVHLLVGAALRLVRGGRARGAGLP